MGATFVHRNADIFPNPLTFRPERWIEKGSSDLVNYLVPFSKGPRVCLGIKYVPSLTMFQPVLTSAPDSLAWAEIFLILGNVFRKVDLEIVDTTCAFLQVQYEILTDVPLDSKTSQISRLTCSPFNRTL